MRSPVAELLADLARAMEAAGAAWFLFGAQAAILHGAARLTADVDVTAKLPSSANAESLLGALSAYGFALRAEGATFVEKTRVAPLVHLSTSIPVDVVLAGPGLEDQFLARSVTRDIEGTAIPVASPEDIIVMKMLAGRDKDAADVAAILDAQEGAIDLDYVRGVLRTLEAALGQSDLLPALESLVQR